MNNNSIYLYDTTLRDGTQRKGISLSVNDKIRIVGLLDSFGIPYIECGWPGSNPKDAEFFQQAKSMTLKQAKMVAFGSTRKKDCEVADDANIRALINSETPVVALVGKSWDLHVTEVLCTSLDENLLMISQSVAYLKEQGREVVYDGEHFFDGFKANPSYALSTIKAAENADWVVLCDTNGGSLPEEVAKIVADVRNNFPNLKLGIHTHNDGELAVANSIAAIKAGCSQVQGTINGYGERCGNANLVSLIPTLQHKMGFYCVPDFTGLTSLSRKVSEIVNLQPDTQAPYVGSSAFAHKGGIHVAAVEKIAHSYEHVDPALIGNKREIVVSELSGRGNIRNRAGELSLSLNGSEGAVLDKVKELESQGFHFEQAEQSFELLMRRMAEGYKKPFSVVDSTIITQITAPQNSNQNNSITNALTNAHTKVTAVVKVNVNNSEVLVVSEGIGPVHALDSALRKSLIATCPELSIMRLTDYKVRILDEGAATAATVRVTIEAAYCGRIWCTAGCSDNIITASLDALIDSLEYFMTVVVQDSSLKIEVEKTGELLHFPKDSNVLPFRPNPTK